MFLTIVEIWKAIFKSVNQKQYCANIRNKNIRFKSNSM